MKRSMTLFTSMTLCHFTNDPWHMTSTTLQGEIMWNLFLNTSNSLFNMSILEDEREFHEGELSSTRAVMLLIGLWKTKNDSVVSLTHNAGTKCMYFYQIWGGCAHRGRQEMLQCSTILSPKKLLAQHSQMSNVEICSTQVAIYSSNGRDQHVTSLFNMPNSDGVPQGDKSSTTRANRFKGSSRTNPSAVVTRDVITRGTFGTDALKTTTYDEDNHIWKNQ